MVKVDIAFKGSPLRWELFYWPKSAHPCKPPYLTTLHEIEPLVHSNGWHPTGYLLYVARKNIDIK
jgi:hypothetical protein